MQYEKGSKEGGQVPLEEEAERARLLLLLLPLAPLPLPRMKEACVTTRRWRRTPGAIAKSRLELDAIARVALALAPAAVLPTEFFLPALSQRPSWRVGASRRCVPQEFPGKGLMRAINVVLALLFGPYKLIARWAGMLVLNKSILFFFQKK